MNQLHIISFLLPALFLLDEHKSRLLIVSNFGLQKMDSNANRNTLQCNPIYIAVYYKFHCSVFFRYF